MKNPKVKHSFMWLSTFIIFMITFSATLGMNQTTIRFAYNFTGNDPKAPLFAPYLKKF